MTLSPPPSTAAATPRSLPSPPSRLARLWRGPEADPRWARPALLALLLVTAAAYFWNLTASGWANAFYSAAVQAGATQAPAAAAREVDGLAE